MAFKNSLHSKTEAEMQLNLFKFASFFSSVEDFSLVLQNQQLSRKHRFRGKIICIQEVKMIYFSTALSNFEFKRSKSIFP